MSRVKNIKIKRHTPVRMKESLNRIAIWGKNNHAKTTRNGTPVKDLHTDLDPQVDATPDWYDYKDWKVDWNEWHEDMQVKETLWQRIKRNYKEGLSDD